MSKAGRKANACSFHTCDRPTYRRLDEACLTETGCASIGLSTAIEAAKGAARKQGKNITMATIGTFTTTANGFAGTIKTLNLNVKARIERVENPSDKGPHSASTRAQLNWAPPGRRPPRKPSVTTSRSSWTIRASQRRSTRR